MILPVLPLALALTTASPTPPVTASEVGAAIAESSASWVALRHDLHRHPELSGAEVRTARVLVERLEAAGIETRREVGGHGLVATIAGGLPGPVVAYRADIDAVSSTWPDPAEDIASTRAGVRHICGHDVHATVGAALAVGFQTVRDRVPGTLVFLFQGAEENATGARAMLADGALGDLDPVAFLALHTSPYPAGTIASRPGALLAGRDAVSVELGERSLEELAAALEAIAPIRGLQELQTLEVDDETCLPMLFGPPQGDTIRLSVAFGSEEGRLACRRRLLAALDGWSPSWLERVTDGVWNTPEVVERAARSIREALGPDAFVDGSSAPPMFSEDFGAFLKDRRGAMFWIGVGAEGMPHTPGYRADDTAIVPGAQAMAAALLGELTANRAD